MAAAPEMISIPSTSLIFACSAMASISATSASLVATTSLPLLR
jgi:hypothetical protein